VWEWGRPDLQACNAAIYGRNGMEIWNWKMGGEVERWMINCSIPLILSAYNGRIMDQKIPQLWEISWSYLSQQTNGTKAKNPSKHNLPKFCQSTRRKYRIL
jgi:hypothetical protein